MRIVTAGHHHNIGMVDVLVGEIRHPEDVLVKEQW